MSDGILLAYDERSSHAAAPAALRLATELELPLTLLHVVSDEDFETFQRGSPKEDGFLDRLYDQLRSEIRSSLDQADSPLGSTEIVLVRGEADEVILDRLRARDYRYVVIGMRSRSRVGKLVFGSVAQSILLMSPCPVVAVPVGREA